MPSILATNSGHDRSTNSAVIVYKPIVKSGHKRSLHIARAPLLTRFVVEIMRVDIYRVTTI